MNLRYRCSHIVLACAAMAAAAGPTSAQSFSEGFNNVALLTGLDWVLKNQSEPLGSLTDGWIQGDTGQFFAFSGPTDSYVASNFNAVSNGPGVDTISTWLIAPVRTFSNGDTIEFYTRTPSPVTFPDRMQVRLNKHNTGTDTGTTSTDVGDFDTLLADINPLYLTSGMGSYPTFWFHVTVPISGLSGPTPGRFAFRYFVEDGGPAGNRSNYIGIDSLDYTVVPEPGTALLLLLSAPLLRRRRR